MKDLADLPKISEIQELAGDRPSPEFLKEMEGELRRRETKMGLAPAEQAETVVAEAELIPPPESSPEQAQ